MTQGSSLSFVGLKDLLGRIRNGTNTGNDLQQAIAHFYSAPDVSSLGELLDTGDENVVATAVYILAEIGKSGFPLREKAKTLLTHPDVQIRYWAMNSVVSCFGRETAKSLITAAGLLSDVDEFVRTRAHEMIIASS
jgi:hypothetical protein